MQGFVCSSFGEELFRLRDEKNGLQGFCYNYVSVTVNQSNSLLDLFFILNQNVKKYSILHALSPNTLLC